MPNKLTIIVRIKLLSTILQPFNLSIQTFFHTIYLFSLIDQQVCIFSWKINPPLFENLWFPRVLVFLRQGKIKWGFFSLIGENKGLLGRNKLINGERNRQKMPLMFNQKPSPPGPLVIHKFYTPVSRRTLLDSLV